MRIFCTVRSNKRSTALRNVLTDEEKKFGYTLTNAALSLAAFLERGH